MVSNNVSSSGIIMAVLVIGFILVCFIVILISHQNKKERIAQLIANGYKYALDANKFKIIEDSYIKVTRKHKSSSMIDEDDITNNFPDEEWYEEKEEVFYRQLVYKYEKDKTTLNFESDKIFKSLKEVQDLLSKQDILMVFVDKNDPENYHMPLDFLEGV